MLRLWIKQGQHIGASLRNSQESVMQKPKWVFIGPHIHKLFRDKQFNQILKGNKKRVWNGWWLLATNFLGNNKADNSNELVENLLFSSQKLDFIMSFKIVFTNFHQDIFPEKCGALNSEHGECHHVISAKEKTYHGKWSSLMLADYCRLVTRNSPGLVYEWLVKTQCI